MINPLIILNNQISKLFRGPKPFPLVWIFELNIALDTIPKAILHLNNQTWRRRILEAFAAKGVSTAVTVSIIGLIGMFGKASTGTAIASLSGAAATSATLYWIGSTTLGLGVATGFTILLIVPFLVGWLCIFFWRRTPRKIVDLKDEEITIISALHPLTEPTRETFTLGKRLSEEELIALSEWADELLPVLEKYIEGPNFKKLAPKFKIAFSFNNRQVKKFKKRIDGWIK